MAPWTRVSGNDDQSDRDVEFVRRRDAKTGGSASSADVRHRAGRQNRGRTCAVCTRRPATEATPTPRDQRPLRVGFHLSREGHGNTPPTPVKFFLVPVTAHKCRGLPHESGRLHHCEPSTRRAVAAARRTSASSSSSRGLSRGWASDRPISANAMAARTFSRGEGWRIACWAMA